jgi:N-acetylated-alpha-linked acidic dipeptidase
MPIDAREREFLEGLSDELPWALVERFSVEPRWRPEDVNKGADIIVDYARQLGLPIEVHEATIHLSIPHEASVGIGGRTFRAKPPALSAAAPDGLTAQSLYIAANPKNLRLYSRDLRDVFGDSFTGWDDFKQRIAGRVLVTEGFGNPALTSLMQDLGAAGLVVINPGKNIHWGTSSMVWGSPGIEDLARQPTIPVVAVNKEDGNAIKAMAQAGEEITITSRLEAGWFRQKVPVVTIPGNEEADRFVLVHGHYDSWDVGVGDNATGDAVLLGLADALWRSRDKLRRSVRVAWWPGHSTGRYSGSTWYADTFGIDLEENCVATINCDSPGCRWATSYHKTTCMSELHDFVSGVITDVTGTPPQFIRPKRAGDASFLNIGISSYFSLSSTMPDELLEEKGYYEVSGCGGNIAWHTEDDQMDIADREILNVDLRIYALSALRHASAKLLPNDWRATAREFAGTLDRYAQSAGDAFDFTPLKNATDGLADKLELFYAAAGTGDLSARDANDAMMRLARILVPLNFARMPRFSQDPAIACPALPALNAATVLGKSSGDVSQAAVVDLRRGANHYLAALRDAGTVIDGVLS